MTKKRYTVELSPESQADLRAIEPFRRGPILKAIMELEHQAAMETRHRKPLISPVEELPEASWELVVGDFRAFYQLTAVAGPEEAPRETARVLRVILKGRANTLEAVRRARKR